MLARPRTLVLTGTALLLITALTARAVPSGDYLFVPNAAQPVAGKVAVEGEHEPDGAGGIYYVDVKVKKASWLEQLLPFLRPEGASLVSGHAVTGPGVSFAERRVQARAEMARSEQVAAAVAVRAAGLEVDATPRGALIEAVATDVPAARELRGGDVIVGAAGKAVRTPGALIEILRPLSPGERVRLRVRRGDEVLKRTVLTVAAPDDAGRAIIGVRVSQDARIRLPVDVDIDLGDVGGPSAGLPFALQIFQELGMDVDRGYRIAATGEIELDGSVLSVGGIKQKTVGVRRSGADIFLVPAGENAATARRYAGTLRIVPVESFRQALRALQTIPEK